MAKKKEKEAEVEVEEPQPAGVRTLTSTLQRVVEGEIGMAEGRIEIGEWWLTFNPEHKKEYAKLLLEKAEMMRKVADAIYQEFQTISASDRS